MERRQPVPSDESARQMMRAEDFSGAAAEYLRLAEQDKQNANIYRLRAIIAYIEADLYQDAEAVLKQTPIDPDNYPYTVQRNILSARLALESDQSDNPSVLFALLGQSQITEANIPVEIKAYYHDVLSRIYLLVGNHLAAAEERLKESAYLRRPRAIDKNTWELWAILDAIPETKLDALQMAAPTELMSWLELHAIYYSYQSQPARLRLRVDDWTKRYPQHPAYTIIIPALLERSTPFTRQPDRIALLLPFSGPYKSISTAIQNGFLAARYMDTGADKVQIDIYDTNALDIVETYKEAIEEGAEYIVGPLEKEAIRQLANYGNLPAPVLALNRRDQRGEHSITENLIEFGLAPEDEARQIAEMALTDGHALALIVTPDIPWGERIATAFKEHWTALGGQVLEHTRFGREKKDFVSPVKRLLNIDDSLQRIRGLRVKSGRNIIGVERRRQDADFIFAVAVPDDARQLLPQLRFYRAGDLPVYSTSHVFSGIVDNEKDGDLEDIIFVDIPWLLDTRRQLSAIQETLNRHWSQDKSNYRRLYALGIDAWHLARNSHHPENENDNYFSGETGDLIITPDHLVQRRLLRAQFVKGEPVLLP